MPEGEVVGGAGGRGGGLFPQAERAGRPAVAPLRGGAPPGQSRRRHQAVRRPPAQRPAAVRDRRGHGDRAGPRGHGLGRLETQRAANSYSNNWGEALPYAPAWAQLRQARAAAAARS